MSVDLTLFLFKPGVGALDELIPADKRGPDAFQKVPAREGFDVHTEVSCWVKKTEPQPTSWCDWLEAGFVFGDRRPQTQSSGCLILLKATDRAFAVCFGTGHHALPGELIEREFGLTVALNEVNPKQLRAMVTKSIDVKTRQRDTRHVAGAEVPEFALDLDMEWLRAAEGHTERSDCNVVAGGDSLHLRGWKRPLADLPRACADFLAIFNRGVPEAFGFADSVKPIHESEPLHEKLEADLYAAMQLRYFEVISVGVDARLAHSASQYVILYDRQRWEITGLDDESLMRGLDQVHAYHENFDPERVLLLLLDSEGTRCFVAGSTILSRWRSIGTEIPMYASNAGGFDVEKTTFGELMSGSRRSKMSRPSFFLLPGTRRSIPGRRTTMNTPPPRKGGYCRIRCFGTRTASASSLAIC